MSADGLFFILFFSSIFVASLVPPRIKRAHQRAQNHLLDRCRALYVLGAKALDIGDAAGACSFLLRIRRIEARWRLGNSVLFRIAKAVSAIGIGIAGYIGLRYAGLFLLGVSSGNTSADMVGRVEDLPLSTAQKVRMAA